MTSPSSVRVLVVGSGFAGLGMAIRLKQAGTCDFAVLERAGEVGGTWRDNTEHGRNTTLWPGFTWRFRRETAQFDPSAYELSPSARPLPLKV